MSGARPRVGIAGLGTVGSAVVDLMEERAPDADLVLALVRDPAGHLGRHAGSGGPLAITADPAELLDARCDVVLECTGDVEVGHRLALATLSRGAGFVTANKQCLALHGAELSQLAGPHRAALDFEAAAGGGMPVIAMLRHALRADRVQRIAAVLNGTTNLVLDRMAAGDTMAAALAGARRAGLAEADATADLEAHDPVAKLAILAAVVWGAWPDPSAIGRVGISQVDPMDIGVAAALDCVVRLVARAEAGAGAGVALAVEPTLVPVAHPLARLRGADNAVVVDSDLAGRTVLSGTGAGGRATASAMLSDLVSQLRAGPGDDRGRRPTAARLATAPAEQLTARAVLRLALPPGAGPHDAAAAVRAAGLAADEAQPTPGDDRTGLVVTAVATAERRRAAVATLGRGPGGYAVRSCLPLLET